VRYLFGDEAALLMSPAKSKILVVDDDPGVLTTTRAILINEGYDVEGVVDGDSALAALRQTHFDLVLTDLKMPGIDGLAVLAEVQKRSPLTVTVMMTGYGSVGSALEAVKLGAYEYLLKPMEVKELKQAVRRSLERKRLSEIDSLYQVSRTVVQSSDPLTIESEVAEAVKRVLGLKHASLLSRTEEGWSGAVPDALLLGLNSDQLIAPLEQGQVVTDRSLVPQLAAWADLEEARSFALVPGITNNRVVCILCVHNGPEAYDFHASAQRFLQGLTSQTALSIENATLISKLRGSNKELADANQKLQELDRLKSKFLSVATHELRTPLSVILGYNSMLAESLGDRLDEQDKQTLVESIAACKRLIRLVNSMLDINQIESGRMKMSYATQDMRDVVSRIAALFQQDARSKDIRLTIELPTRLPKMEMDVERIEQVLVNLVGNALKFTPGGGVITISVRARSENREIEVAVKDTGPGITEEDQEKIFDEFSSVRRRHQTSAGSGLGLAIVKRIVEGHGGHVQVKSAPGRGSTFTFTVPTRQIHALRNSAATA
jgi:signal transduction histidine kinase/CheY-like chemotaxis protein